MKALTVRQPWAWAIMQGIKTVENRTWFTKERGIVAIHSAKVIDSLEYSIASSDIETFGQVKPPRSSEVHKGFILGIVELVDCISDREKLSDKDDLWYEGNYGFVLRNPRILSRPLIWKGQLGFWNVPSMLEYVIKSEFKL